MCALASGRARNMRLGADDRPPRNAHRRDWSDLLARNGVQLHGGTDGPRRTSPHGAHRRRDRHRGAPAGRRTCARRALCPARCRPPRQFTRRRRLHRRAVRRRGRAHRAPGIPRARRDVCQCHRPLRPGRCAAARRRRALRRRGSVSRRGRQRKRCGRSPRACASPARRAASAAGGLSRVLSGRAAVFRQRRNGERRLRARTKGRARAGTCHARTRDDRLLQRPQGLAAVSRSGAKGVVPERRQLHRRRRPRARNRFSAPATSGDARGEPARGAFLERTRIDAGRGTLRSRELLGRRLSGCDDHRHRILS